MAEQLQGLHQAVLRLISSYWLPLTIWVAVTIALGSLWPQEQMAALMRYLRSFLFDANASMMVGDDKIRHGIAYFLLVIPSVIAKPSRWLWIGLLALTYGGLIELIQPLTGRHREWLDLLANFLGCSNGLLLGYWLAHRKAASQHESTTVEP